MSIERLKAAIEKGMSQRRVPVLPPELVFYRDPEVVRLQRYLDPLLYQAVEYAVEHGKLCVSNETLGCLPTKELVEAVNTFPGFHAERVDPDGDGVALVVIEWDFDL